MSVEDQSRPQSDEPIESDEELAKELILAIKEADEGDFVSEEEVWAEIDALYGA
ncbi:MAG: hypothetical protein ABTQ32_27030 [Myxococcaceae bacterium]